MDIQVIEDAIRELEEADATVQNVEELADLYIVHDYLTKTECVAVQEELSDILPSYRTYCTTKGRFQRNEVSDDAVICALESLCLEIKDFIRVLYSNTDMVKERRRITQLLEDLHTDIQ